MFVISFHFSSPSQYLSNYRRYQGWNEHLKVGYDNRFKQKFTNKELNSILLKLYSYTVVIAFFVVAFASTVFWFFAPKENRTYVNNSSPYIKLGETTLCNCIIIRMLIFTSKNIHESSLLTIPTYKFFAQCLEKHSNFVYGDDVSNVGYHISLSITSFSSSSPF